MIHGPLRHSQRHWSTDGRFSWIPLYLFNFISLFFFLPFFLSFFLQGNTLYFERLFYWFCLKMYMGNGETGRCGLRGLSAYCFFVCCCCCCFLSHFEASCLLEVQCYPGAATRHPYWLCLPLGLLLQNEREKQINKHTLLGMALIEHLHRYNGKMIIVFIWL